MSGLIAILLSVMAGFFVWCVWRSDSSSIKHTIDYFAPLLGFSANNSGLYAIGVFVLINVFFLWLVFKG